MTKFVNLRSVQYIIHSCDIFLLEPSENEVICFPLLVATDNAMEERCFICGGRVGRGNQPSIGMHERMSKLVWINPNSKK